MGGTERFGTTGSRVGALAWAGLVLLSACGGGGGGQAPPSPTASVSSPRRAGLSLDESIAIPGRSYRIAIKCWGQGSPTIVLEPGDGDGVSGPLFTDSYMEAVAAEGTACAYDHAGKAASDPVPPGKRRVLRDVVDDLHALLVEAGLPTPYVLAGNSFGGYVVMDYAAAYPTDVGVVVLLDAAAPSATITEEEIGGSWQDSEDLLDALEAGHRLANHPPEIASIPLRVVTASQGGQVAVEDQSFWMALSTNSVSVVLEGGHGLFFDNPEGVVTEIHEAIASIPS
jgi:hypothetical protein